MVNKIQIDSCSIISTHLKRPAQKNIEMGITHVLTSELNYLSPSDRIMHLYIEGVVTSKNIVDLRIEMVPYYINIDNPTKTQQLKKGILFTTQIELDKVLEDIVKEVKWVLDYFGLTIMYIVRNFKTIKIEKIGKGYTLEYMH